MSLAALVLGACGYRAGVRSRLHGARTVHVAPAVVDAREVGAQGLLTRALREEIAARAGLRHASEGRAELLVAVRVHAYERTGLAFPVYAPGQPVRIGEFRATLRASAVVRRRADGRVVLDTGELTLTTEHLPGADVAGAEANRERAVRQLAADLARRVAELLADAF